MSSVETLKNEINTLGKKELELLTGHATNRLKQLYTKDFVKDYRGFKEEMLITVFKTLESIGIVGQKPVVGFMGTLYNPDTYTINFAEEIYHIPLDNIILKGMSETERVNISIRNNNWVRVMFTLEPENEEFYAETCKLIEQNLREKNPFFNKIVELKWDESNEIYVPHILNLNTSYTANLTYSADISRKLVPLVSKIKNFENGKSKYTVLLTGPGGVGKTEAMFRYILPLALEKGFTIFYCQTANDFQEIIRHIDFFCKNRSAKCLVLVEDIDQAFDEEEREEQQQRILNTLDGGDNKESKVIYLFTTNYPETISSFMIRRMDKLIKFVPITEDIAVPFVNIVVKNEELAKLIAPAIVGLTHSYAMSALNEAVLVNKELNVPISKELVESILQDNEEQRLLIEASSKRKKPPNLIYMLKDALDLDMLEEAVERINGTVRTIEGILTGKR